MMKQLKNEDAFTGLEAAIVLIAFIVVAAVFSYVMLGAGFFATQEAQRTVHTGSQQASSSLEIIGNVYGRTGNVTENTTHQGCIEWIEFTVGNTAGGTPIDITQMLVTFVCGTEAKVIPFNSSASIKGLNATDSNYGKDGEAEARAAILKAANKTDEASGAWGVIMTYNDVGINATGASNRNNLLEPGEQFVLAVAFPRDDKGPTELTPNTRFSVNLQPAIGAAFPIKKTVPSSIREVNII